MNNKNKTIIFEREYGVSIDDFEDTMAIDRFIESKIGRPLKITDRRNSFTMRGGNVFRSSDMTKEELEKNVDESIKAIRAQRDRLEKEQLQV